MHITGRSDTTIKISGYRVDLKEIENISLEISKVVDCKAFVIKKGIFKILVLCILSGKEMNIKNIKSHLEKNYHHMQYQNLFFSFKKFPKNKILKLILIN